VINAKNIGDPLLEKEEFGKPRVKFGVEEKKESHRGLWQKKRKNGKEKNSLPSPRRRGYCTDGI